MEEFDSDEECSTSGVAIFSDDPPSQGYWGEFEDDNPFDSTSFSANGCSGIKTGSEADQTVSSLSVVRATESLLTFFEAQSGGEEQKSTKCYLDPLTVHTIELLEYQRILSANKLPKKIPELPLLRHLPAPLNGRCRLSEMQRYGWVKKSCAALLAQVGFQECESECLEVVADVCGVILAKICSQLATFSQRRKLRMESPSSGELNQALSSSGVGSVSDIWKFYKGRVMGPHRRLLAECRELERGVRARRLREEVESEMD